MKPATAGKRRKKRRDERQKFEYGKEDRRLCGAKGQAKENGDWSIQNRSTTYELIGDLPTDEQIRRVEIQREFIFEGLPGINRFNLCPLGIFLILLIIQVLI